MAATGVSVALVHDSQRFDGMRRAFLLYVRALTSAGWPVHPYTCVDPSWADRTEVDGTAVVGRRLPGGGAPEMAFNRLCGVFTRRLARLPDPVVHVHSVHLAPVARRRRGVVVGIPDLAKRTTRYYPRGASWLHNRLLRALPSAAAVVTSTEWDREDIGRVLGYPLDRIVAAPPFVVDPPPSPFPKRPEPPTAAAPWTLLNVSTDRRHKNVELFLHLLAALDDRFRGLRVGRLTPEHRAEVARLGLGRRLEVVEGVDDLLPIYRSAQLLIFPSRYEGFGLPLLEAMAQGLPVLAAPATSVPEVVATGGRLVDPDDVPAWRAAVLDLADPDRHVLAQRRALERARTFTKERTLDALERAYAIAAP